MNWDDLKIFCQTNPAPGGDDALGRRNFIVGVLEKFSLPYKIIPIQGFYHVLVPGPLPASPAAPRKYRPKILVAHYDRVPGTPGANDNSASVFHLLLWLIQNHQGGEADFPYSVLFTDGEEVYPPRRSDQQGSRNLGTLLSQSPWADSLFVVFDMTGIGDTPVLGQGVETQLKRFFPQGVPGPLRGQIEAGRLHTRKILAGVAGGGYVELPTPFSDDLGFLLAGIPAVQISVLPRRQALEAQKNGLSPVMPPAWRAMHSPQDLPETLDAQAREMMSGLITALIRYPLPPLSL